MVQSHPLEPHPQQVVAPCKINRVKPIQAPVWLCRRTQPPVSASTWHRPPPAPPDCLVAFFELFVKNSPLPATLEHGAYMSRHDSTFYRNMPGHVRHAKAEDFPRRSYIRSRFRLNLCSTSSSRSTSDSNSTAGQQHRLSSR